MKAYRIDGGVPLQGNVRIQGSKNAALPVLAATLLTGDGSTIENCPNISDVNNMLRLLEKLGCRVSRGANGITVDSSKAGMCDMAGEEMTGMRSSLCLLGAMLGRFGSIVMEYPGGCLIGDRPIDLHIKSLSQMGVVFSEKKDILTGTADSLHGADLSLPIPSVGATENIILAAVAADGITRLKGAAREPEVETLCRYLIRCGADIEGTGTSQLKIKGSAPLHGTQFHVPADRIVAGTYLFACVGCGGSIFMENAPCDQLQAVICAAEKMGAVCLLDCEQRVSAYGTTVGHEMGMFVQGPERISPIAGLETAVYPGFPTDLQSAALSVLTCAQGYSLIHENLFENRFRTIEPLEKMGADVIRYSNRTALVKGVRKLRGAEVEAKELRGGAALILAGLMADGCTSVTGCAYVERGYENIGKDLRDLGARIVSV